MNRKGIGNVTQTLQTNLRDSIGFPFQEFFREENIDALLQELGFAYRDRVFNPLITLLTFIAQILIDKCCRSAVSRAVATIAATGLPAPSTDTGAYCQARSKLPERFFERMLAQTAQMLDENLSAAHLWLGRHRVFATDGSSAQAPDTPDNRRCWGLPPHVKPGCGFPVVPFVGFFSLLTGSLVRLVIGKKGTHERRMFRAGSGFLCTDDVCVGDRGFCSYADIALLQRRGVHTVFRLFNRESDFRKGKRLGRNDHLITWTKPVARPRGMSKREFRRLPTQLTVREIRVHAQQKGCRSQEIIIVTSLLDPAAYKKDEVAALYLQRWEIELDFRHIKTTLGMEMVSTKKAVMVRKEIMTYMIAYNMIRTLMWRAAEKGKTSALRLSFKGTLQHLEHMSPHLGRASSAEEHERLLGILYAFILETRLPNRPGRVEPRVRKRRPKAYPLMTRPRSVLKQEILNG
jgi:hypothetical protein